MKAIKQLSIAMLTSAAVFSSCSKDEDDTPAEPVITNFSVGAEAGGGKTVNLGGLISYEFDVEASGDDKLAKYHLEMHSEAATEADEYKVLDDDITADFDGLRNTHVHDHAEVSYEAPAGTYHFHLTVTTQGGYTASEEFELEVVSNPAAPKVTDFTVQNMNGGTEYAPGDTVVVSFTATASEGTLDHYHLEIHDEPASGNVEDETKLVDDEFTANIKGETEAIISHIVAIPADAAGAYHVHATISDTKGNGIAKAASFEVK